MSKKENKPIATLLKEFETIVAWFEGEDFSLEDALKKYQEAEVLSKEIESRLSEVKNEITIIKQRFDE